jgi:hypothetical protein
MAEVLEAPKKASDKKADQPNKKIFGKQKQPDLVLYRLLHKNDKTQRTDTPDYPPYTRFPNYDIITWGYKNEDGSISESTRAIRWLPAEQSIFVDEQEKDGRRIPDNIINNPNNRFEIIDGFVKVQPHQKTKIYFLDICNRNSESTHRTGTVGAKFKRYTEEDRIAELSSKQVEQKKAMEKAFSASDEQIYAQAVALNIPIINNLTGGSRDYEAIVTDYRQTAMDNPIEFIKVFDAVK